MNSNKEKNIKIIEITPSGFTIQLPENSVSKIEENEQNDKENSHLLVKDVEKEKIIFLPVTNNIVKLDDLAPQSLYRKLFLF